MKHLVVVVGVVLFLDEGRQQNLQRRFRSSDGELQRPSSVDISAELRAWCPPAIPFEEGAAATIRSRYCGPHNRISRDLQRIFGKSSRRQQFLGEMEIGT